MRYVTKEAIMSMMDMSNASTKFTARKTCSQGYPMQFLVEYMNAVLEEETGKLLEYRQLNQRPKCKDDWRESFANRIVRLVQGIGRRVDTTITIFFITKCQVPPGLPRMVPTAELFAIIAIEKLEKTARY